VTATLAPRRTLSHPPPSPPSGEMAWVMGIGYRNGSACHAYFEHESLLCGYSVTSA
jgi:hypothetical protein